MKSKEINKNSKLTNNSFNKFDIFDVTQEEIDKLDSYKRLKEYTLLDFLQALKDSEE